MRLRIAVLIAPILFGGWLWAPASRCEEVGVDDLPVGSHPPALEFPYFPDRAHAVVFRNWQLVEPARIAATIGTDVEMVDAMARSMGLPPAGDSWREFSRRGYITIVRRNWHLLPYEQLLTLLDMSAERLDFALREDDFLFIKLGRLKPRCEPVVYSPPDAETSKRLAQIRKTVQHHFAGLFSEPRDPPFAFVERLSKPIAETVPAGQAVDDAAPRYIYSYFGAFGDPLLDPSLDPYPDGLLQRLARQGVNGVWLHTVLRQLAPGGPDFPEFGEHHERRLETLVQLVRRARRFGIGVYLYMNEPRAMPDSFFRDRPDMAGVRERGFMAMCTSVPQVRRWLADALTHVFREVPGLAGVFTITASENFTSCASHGTYKNCKRCGERSAAEIIAEVNATIERGVHRAQPDARVIVWDWGWNGHGRSPETIALLPDSVWLQSVSEWSLPITRGGVSTRVGEYSVSAPGPGPRARHHWRLARERGLRTVAKMQLNTTWELASVPWLPVLDLVAEHCENLAQEQVDGAMLSWTIGGYPSPNLQVAARYADDPSAHRDAVLGAIARERYGAKAASTIRDAWRAFSDAFREYPYHIATLYNGPQQMGAANPLHAKPSGFRPTMVGLPYDGLDTWRGPYPREVFAGQFEKVARGWREGVELLENALATAPEDRRELLRGDLRIARAAGVHFASVANQIRWIMARDHLAARDLSEETQNRLRQEMSELLEDEIRLAREQFALAWTDARVGFEASNHYFYTPLDLVEKVLSCTWMATEYELEPSSRAQDD